MSIKRAGLIATIALLALAGSLLLVSCAAQEYAGYDSVEWDAPVAEDRAAYDDSGYYAEEAYPPSDAAEAYKVEPGQAGPRRIIRNGSIELSVKDTKETVAEIRQITEAANGLISESYIYETRDGLHHGHMTLRIPETRFDLLMEQLEELGKAANVQFSQQDVTMQYVDLESRLNNQKAQEERLREILEMAENVEEVLEVERELYRVRGEIESMTAQFTYLQDQVAYSTILVTLREESIPTETISPSPFEDFGSRISQALIGSINFLLQVISVLAIAMVALIPIAIVLAIPVTLIWLLVRKRIRQKLEARESSAPSEDNLSNR